MTVVSTAAEPSHLRVCPGVGNGQAQGMGQNVTRDGDELTAALTGEFDMAATFTVEPAGSAGSRRTSCGGSRSTSPA